MDSKPETGSYAVAFGTTYLLWLLLIEQWSRDELIAGFVVAAVAVVASGRRLAVLNGLKLSPTALLALAGYLGYFVVALIRANIDMARRVLSPSLPINPELVSVKTGLQSDLGRMLLANSITLTPGTLSVDFRGDELLVHWNDVPADCDIHLATQTIADGFERHIGGFLK